MHLKQLFIISILNVSFKTHPASSRGPHMLESVALASTLPQHRWDFCLTDFCLKKHLRPVEGIKAKALTRRAHTPHPVAVTTTPLQYKMEVCVLDFCFKLWLDVS